MMARHRRLLPLPGASSCIQPPPGATTRGATTRGDTTGGHHHVRDPTWQHWTPLPCVFFLQFKNVLNDSTWKVVRAELPAMCSLNTGTDSSFHSATSHWMHLPVCLSVCQSAMHSFFQPCRVSGRKEAYFWATPRASTCRAASTPYRLIRSTGSKEASSSTDQSNKFRFRVVLLPFQTCCT